MEAPWLLMGPINGACFRTYVEEVLVPTLRPGDIVVLDNLGSHKGKAVRDTIRAAGPKLLFLPKYSPDLNPIEQLFAKIKHRLRTAAQRSFDTVSDALKHVLGTVSEAECANYLVNAGYKLALDYPERVAGYASLAVVPTIDAMEAVDSIPRRTR